MNRPLIRMGLGIYALALFTSFMHVWEVYARYGGQFPFLDRVWVALGVALGLDLTALYYSYLSVHGIQSARLGSYLAVALVWFAVLVSLMTGVHAFWEKLVALVLSSFVLVTTFVLGRVLGELSQRPLAQEAAEASGADLPPPGDQAALWLPTKEVVRRTGMPKTTFLSWARRQGIPSRQEGRTLLWNWEAIREKLPPGHPKAPA